MRQAEACGKCLKMTDTCMQVLRLLHRMWETSADLFVEPHEMRPVRSPAVLPSSKRRPRCCSSRCAAPHPAAKEQPLRVSKSPSST